MKVSVTFDIPEEANKWLANHNKLKGTKADWKNVVAMLLTAFLEDISSDYENRNDGEDV